MAILSSINLLDLHMLLSLVPCLALYDPVRSVWDRLLLPTGGFPEQTGKAAQTRIIMQIQHPTNIYCDIPSKGPGVSTAQTSGYAGTAGQVATA